MAIRFKDQTQALVIPVGPGHLDGEGLDVQIVVSAVAHRQTLDFLNTSELEQGGLLLGRIWSRPSAPKALASVEIIEAVASHSSTSSAYSLQMSAAVWSHAQERMQQINQALPVQEQALRIIGWFHSHPHLGAFFSDTDIDTQRSFFNQPYSVGWVIDPYSKSAARQEAFYLGPECTPLGRHIAD
jgi:proteasome lid subunit RPN8/RPN11